MGAAPDHVRAAPRAPARSRSLNLLQEEKATLEFLHVHHEDLKHAIELAGPNAHNAQETWQRVFRDAERAVLRRRRRLPGARLPAAGGTAVRALAPARAPGAEAQAARARADAGLLGDQDGLFALACNQYRASMNHVADWAKERGLMDHTGEESCSAGQPVRGAHEPSRARRAAAAPRRLRLRAPGRRHRLPPGSEPPIARARQLLAGVPLFSLLRARGARRARPHRAPLALGPMERIIVQDQEGDSLFVVADGEVEVVLRRAAAPR